MLTLQVCMTLLKAVTAIILGKDHLYLRVTVDNCKFWGFLIIFILQADPAGGGGRYSGFQMTSKIEGFFWV